MAALSRCKESLSLHADEFCLIAQPKARHPVLPVTLTLNLQAEDQCGR